MDDGDEDLDCEMPKGQRPSIVISERVDDIQIRILKRGRDHFVNTEAGGDDAGSDGSDVDAEYDSDGNSINMKQSDSESENESAEHHPAERGSPPQLYSQSSLVACAPSSAPQKGAEAPNCSSQSCSENDSHISTQTTECTMSVSWAPTQCRLDGFNSEC
eukprot:3932394-Rhodomonas_salina.1